MSFLAAQVQGIHPVNLGTRQHLRANTLRKQAIEMARMIAAVDRPCAFKCVLLCIRSVFNVLSETLCTILNEMFQTAMRAN